mmetsp:Transcript_72400/g.132537  ORF Transcript_72400/g.132537 Transcript_72400/m.132537 type:complete len:328 (-) Transcript_72400:70-1053(-)
MLPHCTRAATAKQDAPALSLGDVPVELEQEDSSTSGPPASRGSLWEAVLERSLRSGDVDRITAAMGLAQDGGASSDMLTRARAERRRLAEEQLVSAMHSRSDGQPSGAECTLGETCDSAALAEAIKRAVEAGATAELLHEAQMDLQKLSRGKLAAALAAARATAAAAAAADSETAAPLAAAGLVDLQAALRSTQGIPAAQLNEAKRLLRMLREIASPPAIQPEVVVVTKQSPSPPRSEPRGSTALPQVGLQAVLRKRSTSPSHRQRGSSPGRVSPEVLGRSVSTESPSVSALEAGLGKRSDRKSQRPTHPGTRERIRTMQREECTLQ